MHYVIKDGHVLATHDDDQDLTGLYPGADIVLSEARAQPGDPDPTTQDDRDRTAQARTRRDLAARRDADITALFEAVLALSNGEALPASFTEALAIRKSTKETR
jgi:hypothetical protein